jgi:uncharacterized protein YecE (DUF72 family)
VQYRGRYRIDDRLSRLGAYLAPAFSSAAAPSVVAVAVALFYVLGGFLFSYLWTRLYLAGALRRADISSIGERVTRLEEQANKDARALGLVQQQLSMSPGSAPVEIGEIESALKEASPAARQAVFNQAWELRTRTWREPNTKPVMALSIPVFRCLASTEEWPGNHRNHAQLAYALKDQLSPDWGGALKALDTAIELRGPWEREGYLFYEMNRALCRVMLDDSPEPSAPELTKAVIADLRAASHSEGALGVIERSAEVNAWLARNGLTLSAIQADRFQPASSEP